MIEVTNQNFNQIYPHLKETLKNASFIAIDAEFSGIEVDEKISLFDTISEHYEKQRSNIQPYIIVQFGISAYQRVPDEYMYTVQVFNFYLLPTPIPLKNRQFTWQATSLEFLITHGFDLNKHAYGGISYIDEADEAILQQQLQDNELFRNVQRSVSYKEEDELKYYNNQVIEWLKTADETNSFKICTPTPLLQYLAHKELRNCFPNIWTFSANNTITVMKVPFDSRKILEQEEGSILENVLLESYIGFSKVFKLLVNLKKPIIAHNALLDLMFMYQQFYKPLPQKYTDFKNDIHQLFPTIYDTKHLSFEMKNLDKIEKWRFNSLSGLVNYLNKVTSSSYTKAPTITFISQINSARFQEYANNIRYVKYHTAGWDAYFVGVVFIQISYAFTSYDGVYYHEIPYFTHTQLMHSVKKFANCVNIMRSNISHLRLDGPDPASTRPKWLYVKTLTSKPITVTQITEKMMTFGAVDVRQCISKRILIAVGSHGSAKEIVQYFTRSKELRVVPYNPIRHSPSIKLFLWGTIGISSGGIIAWMLQKLQKTS